MWLVILFDEVGVISYFTVSGWLALTLTNSPFWVGATAGMGGLALAMSSLFAGVIVDRVDKRNLIIASQMVQMALSFAIAFLIFTDNIALWHILTMAFLRGLAASVKITSTRTLIMDIVGRSELLAANAATIAAFTITGGGVGLRALFTPGHEVDHVCYYLREDRVMFTGDTVLGASSTSVGDLAAYMNSLELLTKFKHDTICPAHGPVVPAPRGANLVRWQYEHRMGRERQVLAALEKGISEVTEITTDMYPKNLKKGLRPGAERNVNTHLRKLIKEETVEEIPASFKLKG